jgi:hypothetical protein
LSARSLLSSGSSTARSSSDSTHTAEQSRQH